MRFGGATRRRFRVSRESVVSGCCAAEHHFDHGGSLQENVQWLLGLVPRRAQMFENSPTGCRIRDRCRSGGKIEMGVTLEVDDKARVGAKVRQPVPPTRCPRNEEAAVDIEHPDLGPARQAGVPSRGRDVDGRLVSEFDAHNIHDGSVRRVCYPTTMQFACRSSGRTEPTASVSGVARPARR